MKRKLIGHILILCIILNLLGGCSGGQQGTKSTGKKEDKPPNTLETLQTGIDDVIISTMKKDWTESLTKTKEIQKTWSELYPKLQEKGIAQESVDAFVGDLNTLSDSLIQKTLSLPKKEKSSEESGQNQTTQQAPNQPSQDNSGSQGQQGNGQSQSKQANAQPSSDSSSSQGQQSGSGGAQQGQSQGNQQVEINKDPEKALQSVDPTAELNKEELQIVRNAVELQKHVNKFASLFSGDTPGDIYQLKYLLHDVNLSAKEGNWSRTNESMKNLLNLWSSVEPKAEEGDKDLKLQLRQSINELEDAVKEKKDNIIGMKANNSLEILEKLIEAFGQNKTS